jgi:hypothetical protein
MSPFAQAQGTEFYHAYTNSDYLFSPLEIVENGYHELFVISNVDSTTYRYLDIGNITAVDPVGNINWSININNVTLRDIIFTSLGDLMVLADTPDGQAIYQITTGGTIIWSRVYNGQEHDINYFEIIEHSFGEGGYALYGYCSNNDPEIPTYGGNRKACITQLDLTGSVDWTIAIPGFYESLPDKIRLTPDQRAYIISGNTEHEEKGENYSGYGFIAEINHYGSINWMKTITPNEVSVDFFISGMDVGLDGQITFSGGFRQDDVLNQELFMAQLDPWGNPNWANRYSIFADLPELIHFREGYVLSHNAFFPGTSFADHLIHIDNFGNVQWNKFYDIPHAGNEYSRIINRLSSGGLISAGSTDSYNLSGPRDLYVLRTNNLGETVCNYSDESIEKEEISLIAMDHEAFYELLVVADELDIEYYPEIPLENINTCDIVEERKPTKTSDLNILPGLQEFQITSKSQLTDPMNYYIFNLQGQLLQEGQTYVNTNEGMNLPTGIYIIHATNGVDTVTQKIILK